METSDRLARLQRLGLEINSELPTDVFLKGDGSFWMTYHGNEGIKPRRVSNEDVLKMIYKAIEFSKKMSSV